MDAGDKSNRGPAVPGPPGHWISKMTFRKTSLITAVFIALAAAAILLFRDKRESCKGCLTDSAYWAMRQVVVGMARSEVISKLGDPVSSKESSIWIWLAEDPPVRFQPGTPPEDIIRVRHDFYYVLYDESGRVSPPGIWRRHEREPEFAGP